MMRIAKHATCIAGMLIAAVFAVQGVPLASANEGENAQSALQSLSVARNCLAHGFIARLLAATPLPEMIF